MVSELWVKINQFFGPKDALNINLCNNGLVE